MTQEELGNLIDNVLAHDTMDNVRFNAEKKLFREALLQLQLQMNKTPSSFQIQKSWHRWKRERLLELGTEANIDLKTLYSRKK